MPARLTVTALRLLIVPLPQRHIPQIGQRTGYPAQVSVHPQLALRSAARVYVRILHREVAAVDPRSAREVQPERVRPPLQVVADFQAAGVTARVGL